MSTELGDTELCAERLGLPAALDSVVELQRAVDANREKSCSAIAISPTLVVTRIECISDTWSPPLPESTGDGGARSHCERGTASPREDGSFSRWWNQAVDASGLAVHHDAAGVVSDASVFDVFQPSPASACADDLAVLLVGPALPVIGAPVRVDETSDVGDAVTLSGYRDLDGVSRRRELDTTIEALTFDRGTEAIPPRSLVLAAGRCEYNRGGVVLSPDSGALIGLLDSAPPTCTAAAPSGAVVARRIAPLRRMLLEAAASARDWLRAEPSPRVPGRECPQRNGPRPSATSGALGDQ